MDSKWALSWIKRSRSDVVMRKSVLEIAPKNEKQFDTPRVLPILYPGEPNPAAPLRRHLRSVPGLLERLNQLEANFREETIATLEAISIWIKWRAGCTVDEVDKGLVVKFRPH